MDVLVSSARLVPNEKSPEDKICNGELAALKAGAGHSANPGAIDKNLALAPYWCESSCCAVLPSTHTAAIATRQRAARQICFKHMIEEHTSLPRRYAARKSPIPHRAFWVMTMRRSDLQMDKKIQSCPLTI
jgi:hypothetical protein